MSENIKVILDILRIVADISIVGLIIYLILRLIRNNARMKLLFKGLLIVILLKVAAELLKLSTLGYILDFILAQGFIMLAIVFQPEIRAGLEQLGRTNIFFGKNKTLSLGERDKVIKILKTTVDKLSSKKTGAIITLEKNESLYEFVSKGLHMYSDLSSELLESIFVTSTPLHDGAVVIQGNKILCARTYFPITQNLQISETFGSRHRAAIGISEISDCITIVVSEEVGTISITYKGVIFYDLTLNEFEEQLRDLYLEDEVKNEFVENDNLTHVHEEVVNAEPVKEEEQAAEDIKVSEVSNSDDSNIDDIGIDELLRKVRNSGDDHV